MSCRIYTGTSAILPAVWDGAGGAPRQAHSLTSSALASDDLEHRIALVHQSAEARAAEARDAGFAAGKRAATAELEPVLQRLVGSLETLAKTRAELRKQAETDLVKLSIAIARRVLRREITVDPDALQGIVLAALDRIQARDICRVRLHPSHESAVRRHLEAAGVHGIELVPDNTCQPGDLLFEMGRGMFDVSIESQLREIDRGFADVISR